MSTHTKHSARQPRRERGFTLLEAMVVLALLGVILAVGIPNMRTWVLSSKTAGTAQYYIDGFVMARNQALSNNSVSRLVLSPHANGQMNWQVDICFPSPEAPCTAASDNWSTTEEAAEDDLKGDKGFTSVLRLADEMPSSAQLGLTIDPDGATSVYFTPLGWVDTTIGPRIQRIDLTPAGDASAAAPPMAVVLTLAGIASRCKPNADETDPHRCPT